MSQKEQWDRNSVYGGAEKADSEEVMAEANSENAANCGQDVNISKRAAAYAYIEKDNQGDQWSTKGSNTGSESHESSGLSARAAAYALDKDPETKTMGKAVKEEVMVDVNIEETSNYRKEMTISERAAAYAYRDEDDQAEQWSSHGSNAARDLLQGGVEETTALEESRVGRPQTRGPGAYQINPPPRPGGRIEVASEDDSTSGLAVAIQVEEVPVASPFDIHQDRRRREGQEKRFNSVLALGFWFILCAALVSVLSLVFHPKDSNDDERKEPTWAPSLNTLSFVPTSSPSGVLDVLLADLPEYSLHELGNSSSPQWHALDWLERHPNITTMDLWRMKQLFALGTFYYSMSGPQWRQEIRDRWMRYDIHECYWYSRKYGYFTDPVEGGAWVDYQHINSGTLHGSEDICMDGGKFNFLGVGYLELKNLSARIPKEISLLSSLRILNTDSNAINETLDIFIPWQQLSYMPTLTRLELGYNHWRGTLPTHVGLLASLKGIQLYHTTLTGQLPTELGLLTSLTDLNVAFSQFSGTIPSELGLATALLTEFAGNSLTGTVPSVLANLLYFRAGMNTLSGSISHIVGNTSSIVELNLIQNGVTGTLPAGLPPNLSRIDLLENYISGTIPTEIGFLGHRNVTEWYLNFWYFDMGRNLLTGPVPSEIGMASGLASVYLWDNSLTGTLPTELGLLSHLTTFQAFNNSIHGILPSELGRAIGMNSLRMHLNELTGTIPDEFAEMTGLNWLQLDYNHISGTFPSYLSELPVLQYIYLEANAITGTLPARFASDVFFLHAHHNFLSGTLPTEYGQTTVLHRLMLHNNEISGTIPTEFGNATGLNFLTLGSNPLTGQIPSELGLLWLLELDLSDTLLTGTIPVEVAALVKTSLFYLDITGTDISGTIPESLCALNDQNGTCSYSRTFVQNMWYDPIITRECAFLFDCSPILCGCGCDCSSF